MSGWLDVALAQANRAGPVIFGLVAFVALCIIIVRIWRREARRPYNGHLDDYPHENGDGEGW